MEAVAVSGFAAFLMFRNGLHDDAQVSWMLAAASLGFLVWNWPPARIFMGDAGSGFLDSVWAFWRCSLRGRARHLIWPWLILLAAFIVDATVTLLRRMFSRARWYDAHRSHAYQHAAQAWGSHAKVTLAVAAINTGWLFPLAWAACRYPALAPVLAAFAIVPLVYLTSNLMAAGRRPLPTIFFGNDFASRLCGDYFLCAIIGRPGLGQSGDAFGPLLIKDALRSRRSAVPNLAIRDKDRE